MKEEQLRGAWREDLETLIRRWKRSCNSDPGCKVKIVDRTRVGGVVTTAHETL